MRVRNVWCASVNSPWVRLRSITHVSPPSSAGPDHLFGANNSRGEVTAVIRWGERGVWVIPTTSSALFPFFPLRVHHTQEVFKQHTAPTS